MRWPAVVTLLVGLLCTGTAGASTTTTSSATSSTTIPRPPRCSGLGAPCGSCGPAGQCLEHVDQSPPAHVCVNGGDCVQGGWDADADCPPQQGCPPLAPPDTRRAPSPPLPPRARVGA